VPWGELKKGLLDAVCAVAIAFFIAKGHSTLVWLPFVKGMWCVPLWLYVPCAAFLLWFTMNATNCSDGVDGLAGTLTVIALVLLSVLLYVIIGYRPVAHYFLLPCNPEAARWAILLMTVAGAFGGYLWYNAEPSKVLMGDAGSRFLGILVGAASLVTGNPFLVLAFAPIVLVNGGGGLGKLLLLRLAKRCGRDIGEDSVIRRVRFPLHDHCKKNLGWTNAQVLMRFTLLQLVLMPILLVLLVKVR
jgi:phospho-N-acetylmuramoyl-pentapeptide-transferase